MTTEFKLEKSCTVVTTVKTPDMAFQLTYVKVSTEGKTIKEISINEVGLRESFLDFDERRASNALSMAEYLAATLTKLVQYAKEDR